MKKLLITLMMTILVLVVLTTTSFSAMTGQEAHEKYIYPIVRVSTSYGGGSGTILYSKCSKSIVECLKHSTYVLTNHHVISTAIKIVESWDSDLQKNIKKEKRAIVYVEIFKYKDLSTPVGTMKVEADIIIYDESEDLALIKLRLEEKVDYVAMLIPVYENQDIDKITDSLFVMDELIAVGCSLGFPPIPSVGYLSRKNYQIDSLPYHMSSAQIIYGNSGGAIFDSAGQFVGIPSRVAAVGWSQVVPHMGLFIPLGRIYNWLEEEHFDFIYNDDKTEKESLELRKQEIKAKKDKRKD